MEKKWYKAFGSCWNSHKPPESWMIQITIHRAEFLWVHVVTAHAYVTSLVTNTSHKEGNSRSTRYFGKRKNIFPFDTTEFKTSKRTGRRIGGTWIYKLADVLEKYILVHLPDGTFRSGYLVSQDSSKERQGNKPNKEQHTWGFAIFSLLYDTNPEDQKMAFSMDAKS